MLLLDPGLGKNTPHHKDACNYNGFVLSSANECIVRDPFLGHITTEDNGECAHRILKKMYNMTRKCAKTTVSTHEAGSDLRQLHDDILMFEKTMI